MIPNKRMIVLSWNVNGLRSSLSKGLINFLKKGKYDIVMLQEIKTDVIPLSLNTLGYHSQMLPSMRKGYSGTLSLTRQKPLSVAYGIREDKFDSESRVITVETDDFYAVNVYFPNSRRDLSRLNFKLEFDEKFEAFVQTLDKKKPVIIGGDFNTAHTELDIARPKENDGNAGFTPEEKAWMDDFLKSGYTDTYRLFNKTGGHYTWWTYRANARSKNIGWRIDYILVSNSLRKNVKSAGIYETVEGSDHAPIYVEIDNSLTKGP